MNGSNFVTYFNDAAIGQFKDNTTQNRVPSQDRDLVAKIKENFFNLEDHAFNGSRALWPALNNIADVRAISTVNLFYGVLVIFVDSTASDLVRIYFLKNSTAAESGPDWIRPNDYHETNNHKVWKLVYTSSLSSGDIDGGTI